MKTFAAMVDDEIKRERERERARRCFIIIVIATTRLMRRKAVSLEAYQSITLRDVYVETSLNDGDWQVDLLMHCETTDIGVFHSGTWTIRILDNKDVLLHELIDDSLVSGDQEREAAVRFQLKIGADQVRSMLTQLLSRLLSMPH